MTTTALLADNIKCPICFDIPEDKVFQCKNGHIFCNRCSTKLKRCPQCRTSLGTENIRNRTLEQLLNFMEFRCPNKELGCDKTLKRHEIQKHLQYCKFEPFYFCKLIGFRDCPYNAVGSLMESGCKELITHLLEVHPEIQQTSINAGRWLQLNYDNFLCRASTTVASKNNLEKGSTVIWEPHLVTLRETIVLLLLCQISAETRNAAWICLRMTDECGEEDDDRSNIAIQYQIGGEDTNDGTNESIFLAPELTCTAPTMSFKNIEKDLENYALRIPLCVLTSLNFETGNDSKNGKNRGLLRMRVKVGEKSLRNVDGDYDKLNLAEKSGKKVEQMMPVAIKELTQVISTLSVVRQEGNGNGENNRSPDDGATGGEIVFENIYCNSCGARPVTKIRYKCLQCIDFDLCRMCMERRTHSHHVFARIQDLRQNDFFNWKHRLGMLKGKSSYI